MSFANQGAATALVTQKFGCQSRLVLLQSRDEKRQANRSAPYTSRIIKAGALLADTKMLFAHWDESESVQQNLDRIQRENVFGKATRCRIEDVLAIFRQRYLREPSVLKALVRLCRAHRPPPGIERILYFHACQADTLLHDVVTEVIYDLSERR